jgi:PST family polysaccharide transporter
VAIFAATLSGSQTAILNGFRRLKDLTVVNITGSIAAMVLGITAVVLWGLQGVVVGVIAAPILSLCASWYYTAKLKPYPTSTLASADSLYAPFRRLLSLGLAFCATSLMTVVTQFLIRVFVTRQLGIDATGHFQAAWNISVLYLGFVLGAMGTDYYPRLTGVAKDTQASNTMMNEQAEVTLLLSGPVILAMLTLTPWIVGLLYSQAFFDTTTVLRWQILGDIFKVSSWSLAFLLLAQARTAVFFLTELGGNLVYIGCVWLGLPVWGLEATGIAFLICYVFYFFLMWVLVRCLNGFVWRKSPFRLLVALTLCSALVFHLRSSDSHLFLPIGLLLTVAAGGYSFWRISASFGSLRFSRPKDFQQHSENHSNIATSRIKRT